MKKYIVSDTEILGGAPVIAGTRIPIARILFLLKEGYTIQAIAKEFPHVSIKMIEGAINEVIRNFSHPNNATKTI